MRHLTMMIAAAGLLGSLAMPGESKAQAPNAMVQQYGYQYCAIIGMVEGSRRDCMYSTWEQCRASAANMGYCEENPAYIAARANAALVPDHLRRTPRRHAG